MSESKFDHLEIGDLVIFTKYIGTTVYAKVTNFSHNKVHMEDLEGKQVHSTSVESKVSLIPKYLKDAIKNELLT